jgi:hypothetical protein
MRRHYRRGSPTDLVWRRVRGARRLLACSARALVEAFVNARPATTGIVTELLDPRWRVEIEAEAIVVRELSNLTEAGVDAPV